MLPVKPLRPQATGSSKSIEYELHTLALWVDHSTGVWEVEYSLERL